MKKVFFLFLFIVLISGCDLGNTPGARVEDFLTKYQSLDEDIEMNYFDLLDNNNLSNDFQKDYVSLIKKQYENLSYEVKEEEIDGNSAIVTVEIEVLDYKSVLDKYMPYIDNDVYNNKLIKALNGVKKKITYTIDFELIKNKSEKWQLIELNDEQRDKLLGIF